ncbi:MAG TPA: phosphoribosyltransferase family protein [Actinomycetota bacterium]|nr:phosphoribosyltransferase family protein [Actinomycetota bacterium]
MLGEKLQEYAGRSDVIVLGLPRGGVPVAKEVAIALDAPLDVFVVRKLGVPRREELAMGAIASGGVRVLNEDVVGSLRIEPGVIESVAAAEGRELARREDLYRGNRPPLDLGGKVVILVDDGLATGSTMRAAIEAARRHDPAEVVAAVPVAAPSTCESLRSVADKVVCAVTPKNLYAVGQWYTDFEQTSDGDITDLLGIEHA